MPLSDERRLIAALQSSVDEGNCGRLMRYGHVIYTDRGLWVATELNVKLNVNERVPSVWCLDGPHVAWEVSYFMPMDVEAFDAVFTIDQAILGRINTS